MAVPTPVAVHCRILRGGFSGERIVLVRCADGTEKKGLTPTHYCWNAKKEPLKDDEPGNGHSLDGYVAARKHGSPAPGQVLIDIPDGELMTVFADNLISRPASEIASHVPV